MHMFNIKIYTYLIPYDLFILLSFFSFLFFHFSKKNLTLMFLLSFNHLTTIYIYKIYIQVISNQSPKIMGVDYLYIEYMRDFI